MNTSELMKKGNENKKKQTFNNQTTTVSFNTTTQPENEPKITTPSSQCILDLETYVQDNGGTVSIFSLAPFYAMHTSNYRKIMKPICKFILKYNNLCCVLCLNYH